MKMIAIVVVAAMGCGNKSSGTNACADAIGKAVDQMTSVRKDVTAKLPADQKAKLEERATRMDEMTGKLKGAITKRCVEDQWAAAVIDCYATASSMPGMKACRDKLPPEQSAKLKADEMAVMMGAMGGDAAPHPDPGPMPPPAADVH